MLFFNEKCPNCHTYYDETLKECPNCHKENKFYNCRDVSDKVIFLHPLAQIGLFLGGFSYAGMLICELFSSLFLGGIEDDILRKVLVLFFAYLLMVGGLLSIALVTRRKTFLKSFTHPIDYAFGAAYAGLIVLASLVIGMIVSLFYTQGGDNTNQSTANLIITNYPIFSILIMAILGPISEELTYRVGLFSFFRRFWKIKAYVVTCIIFALIHFSFDASDMAAELWSLPSYLVCGLILTIAYEHRGPACSITAHTLYNLTAVLAVIMRK